MDKKEEDLFIEKLCYVLLLLTGEKELSKIVNFVREHIVNIDAFGDEEECSICLKEIKSDMVKNNGCKHKFHRECYYKWISIKPSCPCCRMNPFSFHGLFFDTIKN